MLKSFQFRIYPTKNQEKQLNSVLLSCCNLYNYFLKQRIETYEKTGKGTTKFKQQKELPSLKKGDPFLQKIYSQISQEVLARLDKAYQNFFRRVREGIEDPGFPRYRNIKRYNSITYPQNNGSWKFKDSNKIKLSGIGIIKIINHRSLQGMPKTCTVKKNKLNQWFVIISCKDVPKNPLPKTNKEVGIDLGIKHYLTLSNDTKIEKENFLKKEENHLKNLQRKFSKEQKGTPKRRKFGKWICKIHNDVGNKKKDFFFKTANQLVKNYDTIYMEDLSIKNMLRKEKKDGKRSLRKNIQIASWNQFQSILSYKAEEADKKLVLIDPRNTSKECSKCGNIKDTLPLKTRIYSCTKCGLKLDRDFNASLNIKRLGSQSSSVLINAPNAPH